MNKLRATSLVAFLICSPAFSAQAPADEHEGHHPEQAATPKAAAPVPAPQGASAMQENMKRMQDLMAKLKASQNPAERQKLLDEHSKAMHEQMRTMQGMGMGMGMGGGQAGMMGSDMMKNHQGMMARMEMMELMMSQMMQHLDATRVKPGN